MRGPGSQFTVKTSVSHFIRNDALENIVSIIVSVLIIFFTST